MPISLTEADRAVLDEMLRDIFAADTPATIREPVHRLMAMLVKLDPQLGVEMVPGKKAFTDRPVPPPTTG